MKLERAPNKASNKDQDGAVSIQEEVDEEIDKNNTDEKEWFEYIINRSTKEAEEHEKKTKIPCWTETHKRMKWRMHGELHHFRKMMDKTNIRLAPWPRQ